MADNNDLLLKKHNNLMSMAEKAANLQSENLQLRNDISRLQKELKNWQMRLTLATDFDQCEMDGKNICVKCKIPYHPDYCGNRLDDDRSKLVCDVCYMEE